MRLLQPRLIWLSSGQALAEYTVWKKVLKSRASSWTRAKYCAKHLTVDAAAKQAAA